MSEKIENTGSNLADFTSIKRATLMELKAKYEHLREKMFCRISSEEYLIHFILGDATYCKIRTEQVHKGRLDDPVVEGTTFGWVVLVGKDYAGSTCMFTREASDYEKLYSLHVLGVEDRGEDGQLDACFEFRENIVTRSDGRHEVGVPWVLGAERVQGVQCTTVWTGDNGSSIAVVPNRRRTTVRDHQDRLCWTYYLQDLKEGTRQMVHVNFHARYVKSNPFKSNQVTNSGGVQGETECFYYSMYQAKKHRVRQQSSFQNHCGMDQEKPKERDVARLLREAADHLAVQPV